MNLDIFKTAERIGIANESYLRLCRQFIAVTVPALAELRRAAGDRDLEKILRITHEIAGGAGNLEFSGLADTAWRLQRIAGDPNREAKELESEVETLGRQLHSLEEHISRYR